MSAIVFLTCGLVVAPAWQKYDLNCKGLSIELPVKPKAVAKQLPTKAGKPVTTTSYQGQFGNLWYSVFWVKPNAQAMKDFDDALASNERLTYSMTKLKEAQAQRFKDKARGFESYLCILSSKTAPEQQPVGFSCAAKRDGLVVLICITVKKGVKADVDNALRIAKSLTWKGAR